MTEFDVVVFSSHGGSSSLVSFVVVADAVSTVGVSSGLLQLVKHIVIMIITAAVIIFFIFSYLLKVYMKGACKIFDKSSVYRIKYCI